MRQHRLARGAPHVALGDHGQQHGQETRAAQGAHGRRGERLHLLVAVLRHLHEQVLEGGRRLQPDGLGERPPLFRGPADAEAFDLAPVLRSGPPAGEEAGEGGGAHERARVPERLAQGGLLALRGPARAERRRADLRLGMVAQPGRDRKEVGAAASREDLQRAQHDDRRRVVEDQGRDQVAASLLGEQVQRPHHLGVVLAVERAEQRLQRAQVQLGHLRAAREHPLAQRGAEQLEVVPLQVVGPRHPGHAQCAGGHGEERAAAAEPELGQDQHRGERLAAALAEHVDERLGPRAQRRRRAARRAAPCSCDAGNGASVPSAPLSRRAAARPPPNTMPAAPTNNMTGSVKSARCRPRNRRTQPMSRSWTASATALRIM